LELRGSPRIKKKYGKISGESCLVSRIMEYDHPSQLKITILQVFEDGEEHTSSEVSEILGLKKEIARKQLSRYKDENLLDYQERVSYDEEKERPMRAYHYSITDRGRERLDWLKSAERLFQSSNLSWKKALEEI